MMNYLEEYDETDPISIETYVFKFSCCVCLSKFYIRR